MRAFDPHLATRPVGPQAARTSVAVIGAGPAGLGAALELRRHGFTQVVVLEASNRVGGRSCTFNYLGVNVDLGPAAYSRMSYRMVARLVAEAGVPTVVPPPFLLMDGDGRFLPRALPPRHTVLRYLGHWFAWRVGLLRDEPAASAGSSVAWLKKHGFSAFLGENTLHFTGRSMHYFRESVSMIDFFRWFRPSTVVSGLFPRSITRLPGGFFGLWRALADRHGIAVRTGRPVASVRPSGDGGALVDGERYDIAVLACPPGAVASPLDATLDTGDIQVATSVSKVWLINTTNIGLGSLPAYTAVYADPLTFRVHELPNDPAHKLLYTNQYVDDPDTDPDPIARAALDRLGLGDAVELTSLTVPYFPRFTSAALQARQPDEVEDQQGVSGIWYAGSYLSHYNLESIHCHTYNLVNRIRDSRERRGLLSRMHARVVSAVNSI